jgi:hypothetical protein
MAMVTDFRACAKFAEAVKSAGGTVPPSLANLLAAHTLMEAPATSAPPETDIVTAALAGTLTAKRLTELAPVAASAAATRDYLRKLAADSAHILLGQWHRNMKAGGADAILDSLRKRFDEHAKEIDRAKSLISSQSTAEHVIESGTPELVSCWQELNGHLKVIGRIAAVATQFGPRLGDFPQITEYAAGEGFRIDDRAVMCSSGDLIPDSGVFQRPSGEHRSSPWFRVGGLKLHTIAEAQARYDIWACAEWDRIHSHSRGGWVDEGGEVHEFPQPRNPYRERVS